MERPELNGLLEVIRVGDVLVVTRAGPAETRYTGSLGADQPAGHHGRGSEVLDMPVDAQDVARGGQLVALVTA